MSENDRGPRPGDDDDPTAGPDWAAPTGSHSASDATSSDYGQDRSGAPEQAPTEHIPQGSDPYGGSSARPPNPYAATPPPPPYDPYAATGGQAQQGGYPAYSPPGQWQSPPPAYGAPAPQNTSALVLTILSGIITVSCCIPGIVPLVLGIMALTKQSTDPEGSRRLTRWGWIAFGIGIALVVLAVVAFVALGAAGAFNDGGFSSDPDFSY